MGYQEMLQKKNSKNIRLILYFKNLSVNDNYPYLKSFMGSQIFVFFGTIFTLILFGIMGARGGWELNGRIFAHDIRALGCARRAPSPKHALLLESFPP